MSVERGVRKTENGVVTIWMERKEDDDARLRLRSDWRILPTYGYEDQVLFFRTASFIMVEGMPAAKAGGFY